MGLRLLSALFLLLPLATAEEEWMKDVPNLFEDSDILSSDDDARYMVTRVVDDATNAPIPGARLFAQHEYDHALPRLAKPFRIAVANAEGWIRYPLRPYLGNWYYVDAKGYGPFADMTGLSAEVRLRRGVDLQLTLKDALGRPVPNAHVGYYLGCGHTPDSRQARTDKSGRATIPCVNPQDGILFPVAPRIEARDWYLPSLEPADGRVVIVAPPGFAVEGQILDKQGQPLVGALVHGSSWNHGPRTKTDDEGRFRVEGARRAAWVTVARDGTTVGGFRAPPPGVRRIFRLPCGTKEHGFVVPVAVTDAKEGELDERATVCAVRVSDGLTIRDRTNDFDEVDLKLPRGRYTLLIGDELGRHRQARREITVDRDLEQSFRFVLERQPLLRVDASAVPNDWIIMLASAHAEADVDEYAREGGVPAPEGVELALRYKLGAVCGGIVKVPLRGRGADHPVVVLPKPEIPAPPEFALPEAKPVTVLLPDGSPAVEATVHCRGRNSVHMAFTNEQGVAQAGFRGGHLTVDAGDGWLRHSMGLTGDGPWTVRLASCSILLDVRDADGQALTWYFCTVDGRPYYGEPGQRLRGLAPGVHRILVAKSGHLAKDCRIILKKGEHRKLRVPLKRP